MPSSLRVEPSMRVLRLRSSGAWVGLFALLALPTLGPVRARAQEVTPPDSKPELKAATPGSVEIASKPADKKKVPSKYDINHIGDRGVGNGPNMYSLEREQEMGHALAQDVEMRSKLITDPVITEYVNRLGQRIVRNSDAQVPFTIKVVESDEINAFALPGGYFFVDTGLILAADNEAELAGLMAHEVAHVAARHATRAETRMQIWRYASLPLLYFGGPAGMVLQTAMGLAAPMSFMKFGRDAEREADLLGLEYEYATGYDPQAFVQFFEKLHIKEKQKQNLVAKAFATHPMTEDRIRRAQKEISSMLPDKTEYVVDTSEFQEVKTRLARLMHERPSEDGRPVLHRRGPEEDTPTSGPTLHRPSN
jgi:predicted Zn-dependent protease